MPPKSKKREQKQTEKEAEGSQVSEGEGEEEEEVGEDISENIDPKFRLNKAVNVYVTLPSGDEEIILNYDMCFCDKVAF